MGDQRAFDGFGGAFHAEFHDPVFDPSADFNFDDDPNHMIMSEPYDHQGDFPLYDADMHPEFSTGAPGPQQGHRALPQDYWQSPFQQQNFAGAPAMPPSTQGEIVDNRADSVTQYFGQITPPDTDSTANQAGGSQQAQDPDANKRKERARNAANKRHAKSKKARAESESNGGEDEAGEERGERQAHYREKNRVAAAKCRAKKKNHNDHLEEMHRDEASKNKILKAELMGLRNELAQLKGLTLEHSPDSCQCRGLHAYSMRQASLIARGAAPQYAPSVSSPVQESPMSSDTPTSDVTGDGLTSTRDSMTPAMGGMSRRTSSFAPGSWMQPP